ncbi:hypothetical protein J1N35_022791 [Gossypium stocksii]|uniref:Uncharacterized protein n=1 Tax=Gossypium stocksii TaxID=47602 RepID=A0A9D3VGN5_9ROSI|nr:hypothetical protein J1N35_022791 [Gossypium stocksii]
MRFRVVLDVRLPLKRKKRVVFKQNNSAYKFFQYESLVFFGTMGCGEGFCPVRLKIGTHEMVFAWDLSVRASSRRVASTINRWLREDSGDSSWIRMEVDGDKDKMSFGTN